MARAKKKPKRRAERPFYRRHWGANEARYRTRLLHRLQKWRIEKPYYWWRERSLLHKVVIIMAAILLLCVGSMYGISRWYVANRADQPFVYGASFVPSYARHYGLDAQETMRAMIYDLGVRRFRLVSYWSVGEPTPGTYDFSDLDWQFKLAEESGARISLSVGLRQPRWPECHMPEWATTQPKDVWYPALKNYTQAVVERYRHSPALEEYQLENEFHFTIFTRCVDNDPARLHEEFNLIKSLDPNHPIQMSLSGDFGQAIGDPKPGRYGIAMYKRVYEARFLKRYFEYPFPSWFYAYRAGVQRILTGRDSFIHELQMEPWGPLPVKNMSIEEQSKSMDAKRLKQRFEFSRATDIQTLDMWGPEWWYWRKANGDPSLWNTAKAEIQKTQRTEAY